MSDYPVLHIGQRVRFAEDRNSMRVRGTTADGRFTIATRPAFGTYIYSVIDWAERVRGADDRVFHFSYGTDEEVAESLKSFPEFGVEVSHRNRLPLKFHERQSDKATAAQLPALREHVGQFEEAPDAA